MRLGNESLRAQQWNAGEEKRNRVTPAQFLDSGANLMGAGRKAGRGRPMGLQERVQKFSELRVRREPSPPQAHSPARADTLPSQSKKPRKVDTKSPTGPWGRHSLSRTGDTHGPRCQREPMCCCSPEPGLTQLAAAHTLSKGKERAELVLTLCLVHLW